MDGLKQDFHVKMDQKMQQMMKGLEALLALRLPVDQNNSGNPNHQSGSILGPVDGGGSNDKAGNSIFKTIKFEFPKFDGTSPSSWVRKCNKLFAHHVVAEDQKLYLATLNLEGDAEEWYAGFVHGGVDMTWSGFIDKIMARFGPESLTNPIGKLKNL